MESMNKAIEAARAAISAAIGGAEITVQPIVADGPTVDLNADGSSFHRNVAIAWEGGVTWLRMCELADHFCIDVESYDHAGNLQPTGVFAIDQGRRVELNGETRTRVLGHEAVRMPILLIDKGE